MTNEQITKVTDTAKIEAARLCDQALAPRPRSSGPSPSEWTSAQWARVQRYQLERFERASQRIERVVCDLLRDEETGDVAVSTREELLTAIDVYCAAGIAEVARRFRAEG
jgi:hypothetical protein